MGARSLLIKVNTDPAYRAKFIKDPIGMLRRNGITLGAKDQKELLALIDDVRRSLPSLGKVPKGYEVVISTLAQRRLKKGKRPITPMFIP